MKLVFVFVIRSIMPGKILKTVDWLIDVPLKEEIVSNGMFASSEFAILCNGEETNWSVKLYFDCEYGFS